MKTAVIVDSVRTGLAKSFRGGFNMTRPDEMLAHIINATLERNPNLPPEAVEDIIMGCGNPEGAQGHNVGRNAAVEIGKGRLIKEGSKNLIVINFGALLDQAKEVSSTLGLTLIDMRFVKPLDEDILRKYLSEAQAFVSIEDGSVAGGAGSAVQEFCSDNNINVKSKLFGIPDIFIEHQSREEMIEESGLKASRIIKEIEELELEE